MIDLDAETVHVLRQHRGRILDEREAWGEDYLDEDPALSRDDGCPIDPDVFFQIFENKTRKVGFSEGTRRAPKCFAETRRGSRQIQDLAGQPPPTETGGERLTSMGGSESVSPPVARSPRHRRRPPITHTPGENGQQGAGDGDLEEGVFELVLAASAGGFGFCPWVLCRHPPYESAIEGMARSAVQRYPGGAGDNASQIIDDGGQ